GGVRQNHDKALHRLNFWTSFVCPPHAPVLTFTLLATSSSRRLIGHAVMYARYVPPSKGSKPSSAPSSSPAAARSNPVLDSPTAAPSDGPSYARYVPPAKAVPTKAERPETEPSSTVMYFDDEPSPPKPKRKRDAEETRPQGAKKTKKTEEEK